MGHGENWRKEAEILEMKGTTTGWLTYTWYYRDYLVMAVRAKRGGSLSTGDKGC